MHTHLGGGYEFEATMWQSMIQCLFLADLGLIKVAIKDPNRLEKKQVFLFSCNGLWSYYWMLPAPVPTTAIHLGV